MVNGASALAHHRAGERGAAIFIVVMVLTMLTAIGVFAMRASSLSQATSGFERQATQNHYMSEYGILSAAQVATTRGDALLSKVQTSGDTCWATSGLKSASTEVVVPCYRLFAKQVQDALPSGTLILDTPTFDGDKLISPGSLGPAALTGDFVVELTDPGQVGRPVAGSSIGGNTDFEYDQVTLTSIGQVRPQGDPTKCDDNTAALAGNEIGRAYVVIGPVPKRK